MIDTNDGLAALLPRLRGAEWLAMDTEADSLHAYPEKLCLVQVSLPGDDLLIDPLCGADLSAFWDALRGRELILHGADYDLRLLRRSAGFVPQAVFDTMLASRLLGVLAFGLTDLVGAFVGVTLEKGPQKADWAKRPLTERMIAYARNDTRYLKPLRDFLHAELERKGRLSWHQQACAQLVEVCAQAPVEDLDRAWRIKGSDRLDRRALAVMRELWHWREGEAVAANKPPFFVMSHDTLLAITLAAANSRPLEPLIPRRYSPHRSIGLRQAVERALALPETKLPHPLRNRGQRLTPAQKQRVDELREARDRRAAELQLDPTIIASRAMLTALGRDWDKHAPELLPWQRDLLQR